MMSSRAPSEDNTSTETSLQECQILLQSPLKQNCRKNRGNSKSRVFCKRLKTEPEIKKSSKNKAKSIDDAVNEKENTLRRSKRIKRFDSNIQSGKTTSTVAKPNFKSNVKEIEVENLRQNFNFNFISENVKKSLDKELFPEESDEERNLNFKCSESMSRDQQLVACLGERNKAAKIYNAVQQAVNLENGEARTKESDCDIRSLPNSPQLYEEIISVKKNNLSETDTEEVKTSSISNMANEVFMNIEDKGKCERNNNAKIITNDEIISDPNLDPLHIDIKKADDILNSLIKQEDTGNDCSLRKQTMHTSNLKLLPDNNSMNCTFYADKEDNVFDSDARQSCDTLNKDSSESESSASRKHCQILIHNQQENSLENINCMKNEQIEKRGETWNHNDNLAAKEEYNEVKSNSLNNENSNHIDTSSVISENPNVITKAYQRYDTPSKFNNQRLSKSELNDFTMENGTSHKNNDFNNSQNSKKIIQKCYIEVNGRNNIADGSNNTVENFEIKREKLKLLYMSALDYEKENKKNVLEKDSVTENGNYDSVDEDDSIDKETFIRQKYVDVSEKILNDMSKEIDDMIKKSELQILQNIRSSETLDKKEQLQEDDTQKNFVEMKKVILDTQKTTEVALNTTGNEQPNLRDQCPIKSSETCFGENDKMHDSQELFLSMEDHGNNISLLKTSNNSPVCNNEAIVDEVAATKYEATEKWYKTKCLREADTTFIVTATECFKSEQNKISTGVNDRNNRNMKNIKDDIPPYEDADGSFDMDDDFALTSSQMNMIEMNENNLYKKPNESKPSTKIESCNDTHFGQDSITVEVINQLCYIRESVDSIKELLNTFMMKSDDKK